MIILVGSGPLRESGWGPEEEHVRAEIRNFNSGMKLPSQQTGFLHTSCVSALQMRPVPCSHVHGRIVRARSFISGF